MRRFTAIAMFGWMFLMALSAMGGPADDSFNPDLAIVGKYVAATQAQQATLRGAQMEVDIDATIPKLHKRATFRALRTISRLGQITYRALGFSGDTTVKKEIITRYLAAETEARENGSIAITPDNYKFKVKGNYDFDGRPVAILQLNPRKKAVGLFKGELWVDVSTGMPVREAGEFVKSPSIFLKKIIFVRDYELQDGVAIPKRIESTVDTRVIGKAELRISFTHFSRPAPSGDETLLPETVATHAAASPDPSGSNDGSSFIQEPIGQNQ